MPVTIREAGSTDLPLLVVEVGAAEVRVVEVGATGGGPTPIGPITAVFAPSRGGRLLALRAGAEELLWQNPRLVGPDGSAVLPVDRWPLGDGGMGTWANVGGSKTWPAPQGWSGPDEWAGPPDQVLDSGAWTARITGGTLVLTSPDDPRSGLRITRTFAFADPAPSTPVVFTERIAFANVVDRPVRWSSWEVCQVDTAPGGTVSIDGARLGDLLDLGVYEGDALATETTAGVELATGRGVTKHGSTGGSGGVSYRRPSGLGLRLRASAEEGAVYPDGGCRTEVWLQRPTAEPIASLGDLHPDAHVAELEVLGPLRTLAPGATSELLVTWTIDRIDGAGAVSPLR
ncbi:hypothetical protein [Frondihabitans cladoniiphilus]|uniref:DUF4380 domain-containing protein n=1 Tax=Frondihabitans cladoniiphilus TaxID=715785 RepID=A0ABP8VIF8_9MICO